jgi:hypothetical protein
MLQQRYRFLEFADCGPNTEPSQIRTHIHTRFWLHLGQGWRFFAPDNLITRLTAVLQAEPQVFQVAVNYTDAIKPTGTCAPEAQVRRTRDAGRYLLTTSVANGPAMFDTTRHQPSAPHTATLDEVLCATT